MMSIKESFKSFKKSDDKDRRRGEKEKDKEKER